MKIYLATILLALSIATVHSQTDPLDAPGEKKITVGSEIRRGNSEMSSAATNCREINILAFDVCLDRVLTRNRSNNTDSEGFLLGALLEKWRTLNSLTTLQRNSSADEIQLVSDGLKSDFRKFRELQKKFGLTDDALLSAAGFEYQQTATKALISKYDNAK